MKKALLIIGFVLLALGGAMNLYAQDFYDEYKKKQKNRIQTVGKCYYAMNVQQYDRPAANDWKVCMRNTEGDEYYECAKLTHGRPMNDEFYDGNCTKIRGSYTP